MTKKLWYKTLTEKDTKKIQWNGDKSKGRLRFKFLGLQTEFYSEYLSAERITDHAERVATDIKYLELVPLDPETQTAKYPFSSWQVEYIQKVWHHTLLTEIREAFTTSNTFGDIFALWSIGKKSIPYPERITSLPYIDKEINNVTAKDIAETFLAMRSWVTKFGEKQVIAVASQDLYQRTIRGVFNYAYSHGFLVKNPIKDNSLVKAAAAEMVTGLKREYYNMKQQIIMYQAAAALDAEFENVRMGRKRVFCEAEMFIRFAIWTGARRSDLRNAKWSDFTDVENDHCAWNFKQLKFAHKSNFHDKTQGKIYKVSFNDFHLNRTLLALLQGAYKNRQSDYVFERADGNGILGEITFNSYLKLIIDRANEIIGDVNLNHNSQGVKNIPLISGDLHKCRHTMVSNVISSSGSWNLAQIRCGHKSVKTTIENYGAMMDTARAEAELKMSTWLIKQEADAQEELAVV